MSTAQPTLMQRCQNCGQRIAWSLPVLAWVHEATGEPDCGAVEVRG